jgi:hypothetical protein
VGGGLGVRQVRVLALQEGHARHRHEGVEDREARHLQQTLGTR